LAGNWTKWSLCNVGIGKIKGNTIIAEWGDIVLGNSRLHGKITLEKKNDGTLQQVSSIAYGLLQCDFSGKLWKKT